MKLSRQRRQTNAARARNARGKKRSKGKRLPGESDTSFEGSTAVTELMEDNSEQSSLGKIHAKVQREMDDKADAPVQKKEEPENIQKKHAKKEKIQKKEDTEVAKKEEESTVSKKEDESEISKKEEVQAKEQAEVSPKKQAAVKTSSPRYNTQYFMLQGETGSGEITVKESASAYQAIRDVLRNPGLYSIDKQTLLEIAALFVKAKEMGEEKFDTEFVVKTPVCIKLVSEV